MSAPDLRSFPVRTVQVRRALTEQERAELGGRLAALLAEIEAAKEALRAYVKEHREAIRDREGEAVAMRDAIRSGELAEDVGCFEVEDRARGIMEYVRADGSGVVVSTRELTPRELQEGLPWNR